MPATRVQHAWLLRGEAPAPPRVLTGLLSPRLQGGLSASEDQAPGEGPWPGGGEKLTHPSPFALLQRWPRALGPDGVGCGG